MRRAGLQTPQRRQARAISDEHGPGAFSKTVGLLSQQLPRSGFVLRDPKGLRQPWDHPPGAPHPQIPPSPHLRAALAPQIGARGVPTSSAFSHLRGALHTSPTTDPRCARVFALFSTALEPELQLRRRAGRRGLHPLARQLQVLQDLRDGLRVGDRRDPTALGTARHAQQSAGWPWVVASPGLPQIRTGAMNASGSSDSWVRYVREKIE